ncbi:related to protein phosphatase 2c [Melanopsichium pennsylvanicum]|uniref:Related to protein phosphatase 2c n=2 Tax=Melanopsichium pennsylvanicum TaxID=63383 RepID=A0AAJ4XS91_9BASI|nr:related to protein phosphatase 2c [Melanopsichium pennsylvanicum 4]SNX87595.1 related to protein phosphatase 2c [Melanopsichium pennsylvanicum]
MIKSVSGAVAGPSRIRTAQRSTSTLRASSQHVFRQTPQAASFSNACNIQGRAEAFLTAGTPILLHGKGKQRALDPFPSTLCSCFQQQRRYQQTFVRTLSPSGGQARIQLKSTRNGVFGLSTSRGTRAYQEDTASVSCLHVPIHELRRNYLKLHSLSSSAQMAAAANAALEWDPEKAGGEELAGQVVWFGCFDGHGGQQISSFLRDQLHKTFESVQADMVTDTVQYTRELGGYFRRFTGGVLERWVRKDKLKPVRAGPAAGRRAPAAAVRKDDSQVKQQRIDHLSKPASLSDMLSHEGKPEVPSPPFQASKTILQPTRQEGAIKIGGTADLLDYKSSEATVPTGSADLSWDKLIQRIPPPEGMEKETMTMAERLTLAWLVADRQIQSSPQLDVGGSTASVTLLHSLDLPSVPWYSSEFVGIHVAHVGDTRVLLCTAKDGKAVPLTTYHHPDDLSESERLRKMGAGMITDSFGEARWMGALANTRAFGDSRFKKVGITAEPEIFSQVVRGSDYGFLIAFSDGVGGVMSDQEVVDLCRNAKHPSQAAQSVLTFAEELGAQDNCTVMVIPLKGWGKVRGQDMTRERREMRRSKVDVYRDNRT